MTTDPAEQAILDILALRGAAKTICPTDAARALAGHPKDDSWRAKLAPIKLAAIRLARAQKIDILRKGQKIPPDAIHGVIRLRLADADPK